MYNVQCRLYFCTVNCIFLGSSNVPATSVADNNQYNTVNEPLHNQIKPDESHTTNAATTHPPLSHHPVQHNNMVSERSPRSARSSTSIEFESEEIKQDKPAAPQQPQVECTICVGYYVLL